MPIDLTTRNVVILIPVIDLQFTGTLLSTATLEHYASHPVCYPGIRVINGREGRYHNGLRFNRNNRRDVSFYAFAWLEKNTGARDLMTIYINAEYFDRTCADIL